MNKNILAIILMGSSSDLPHVEKITSALDEFQIPFETRVSSAHKTPAHLLELITEFEKDERKKVYITVAGRSNALSGMVDAQVSSPVIACPPPSSEYGRVDIFSSLRMPSGVSPMVLLDPKNAALAAAKILALAEPKLVEKIKARQSDYANKVIDANTKINA